MKTWIMAAGAAIAGYGGLRLISGYWTGTDAVASDNLISGIIFGVGVLVLIISHFVKDDNKAPRV